MSEICREINCPMWDKQPETRFRYIEKGQLLCYDPCGYFQDPQFSRVRMSQCCYQCYDRKKCEDYKLYIGESFQTFIKLKKIRQYVKECSKLGGKEVIFDEDRDEFYVK